MNDDLISRSELIKTLSELVVGGEKRIKERMPCDGNDWIDGVCSAYREINDAPTVEPKLSDEQIDKITDLLETEWGYEGIREDVSRILRGKE